MSLPRKAVHLKLDHDVHADLLDLCEYDHILPAHWIERLVENELAKEFTRAESLKRRRAARLTAAKTSEARLRDVDSFPTLKVEKS